jgi:hypothetical protein
MASVQEAGIVEVHVKKATTGQKIRVFSKHVSISAPGGGAPDGALASVVKPDQMLYQPIDKRVLIQPDDIVETSFIAEGADGIDVSDSIWLLPLTAQDGIAEHVSRGQFANPAPADYVTVANIPTIVGGFKADKHYYFGGGPIYIDIQDDTA